MRGFGRLLLTLLVAGSACNQSHVKAIEHSNSAMAYHERGLNPQAIDELKEAIRIEPECDICHHNLATVYQATQAWADAAVHYRKAAELTGDAKDWSNLGFVLLKDALRLATSKEAADQAKVEGRLKEAEDALSQAMKVDAELYLPYYYLGQVMREQDRFEDSGKMFKKCIEMNPGFPEAFNEYGKLFAELEMQKEAEAVYKEGLRINPNAGVLHNQLGAVYKAAGKYEDAIREFSEAIKDKDVPEAYFNLGVAYYELGGSKEKTNAEYYLDSFLKSSSKDDGLKRQASIILTDLHQTETGP
jgi:tetratricopeptide (TPR) repeat protein